MFLSQAFVVLSSLLSFSTAHFVLSDPPARGFSENQQVNFPCGGQSVSKSRTKVSLEDAQISIALEMGHDQAAVQVLLGLGNDPGSNFNITLVPTFRQIGLGDFCLPRVRFDEDLLGVPLEDGMNATLQIVTNGDPSGGLYNVSQGLCSHRRLYFLCSRVVGPTVRRYNLLQHHRVRCSRCLHKRNRSQRRAIFWRCCEAKCQRVHAQRAGSRWKWR